MREKRLLADRT